MHLFRRFKNTTQPRALSTTKMVTIYALKDPETGRIRYIGQSLHPEKRYRAHLNDREACRRTNWISSLRIRGLCPSYEALLLVPESEAGEWEIQFIAQARTWGWDLVNTAIGGSAPMTGRKHSPESIARMSKTRKGRPLSVEHCNSIRASKMGNKNPRFGKIYSQEERDGISESLRGVPHSVSHTKAANKASALARTGGKRRGSSSKFVGVCWDSSRSIWRAAWPRNNFLGNFTLELDAHNAVVQEQLTRNANRI